MILILYQLLSILLLLGTGVMESKFSIKWFPNIQATIAQWNGMKGKHLEHLLLLSSVKAP